MCLLELPDPRQTANAPPASQQIYSRPESFPLLLGYSYACYTIGDREVDNNLAVCLSVFEMTELAYHTVQ